MMLVIGIIGVGREYNDRKRHKEHIKMLEKISWNTFNITVNTKSLNPKMGKQKFKQ
jgi:hypothetical protein